LAWKKGDSKGHLMKKPHYRWGFVMQIEDQALI